jgi:hypothetical protein
MCIKIDLLAYHIDVLCYSNVIYMNAYWGVYDSDVCLHT